MLTFGGVWLTRWRQVIMNDPILALIYKADPNEGRLRLFKNNITPGPGTSGTDFVEADFDGYAAIELSAAQQPTGRTDTAGNTVAIDSIVRVFESDNPNASPQTVYGWYITDAGGDGFIAKRFDTPIDVADGTVINLEFALRFVVGGMDAGDDVEVLGPPPPS